LTKYSQCGIILLWNTDLDKFGWIVKFPKRRHSLLTSLRMVAFGIHLSPCLNPIPEEEVFLETLCLGRKAKPEAFEKRFKMSKHPVRQGVFWKAKATGQMIRIHGVNKNSHDQIVVYFLTERMTIEDFLSYHEPCSAMEQAEFIVANIKQPDPPGKTRIQAIEDEEI